MTESQSPSDPSAEQQLPRLLGDAAVAGARAEFALRCLMVGLLDSDYVEVIAAGRSMGSLINDCTALVKVSTQLDDTQRNEVSALLDRTKGLSKDRNRLVHGMLAMDQSGGPTGEPTAITVLYGDPHKPGRSKSLTVAEAQEAAKSLRTTGDELLVWVFGNLRAARRQQVLPSA
ncbi:hypothetical protein AB0A98_22535 [Streptomyces chrestomyceticus]|uniref:hypothetical protein n=1 Tax=Streptomyces chrestomyceticus TaxID=68185 RepID=UPI0033F2E9B7